MCINQDKRLPPPSPELLAEMTRRLDRAEVYGGFIYDLEKGEPTNEPIALPPRADTEEPA
jgi:hypothetical protein